MSLSLQAGTPPVDTVIPTTPSEHLQFVVAYMRIVGGDSLSGVVISETAPGVDQQNLMWVKIDTFGDPLGFYRYNGEWVLMPLIVPSHANTALPATPSVGQLAWNTNRTPLGGLEAYRSGGWTNNLLAEGPTVDRPVTPPNRYRYYDTDISRWIHYNSTESKWTTDDGAVGDMKPIYPSVSQADALTRNPGWEVATGIDDRFLVGASTSKPAGTVGGRDSFTWGAVRVRGTDIDSDYHAISDFAIDGTNADPRDDGTGALSSASVNITPKYAAVIWLRKVVA